MPDPAVGEVFAHRTIAHRFAEVLGVSDCTVWARLSRGSMPPVEDVVDRRTFAVEYRLCAPEVAAAVSADTRLYWLENATWRAEHRAERRATPVLCAGSRPGTWERMT